MGLALGTWPSRFVSFPCAELGVARCPGIFSLCAHSRASSEPKRRVSGLFVLKMAGMLSKQMVHADQSWRIFEQRAPTAIVWRSATLSHKFWAFALFLSDTRLVYVALSGAYAAPSRT